LKFEDFGDVEESDVQETIVEFVKPILKEISWLGREMSASHVLRSLFSLMAGMPVIAERKVRCSAAANVFLCVILLSVRAKIPSINTQFLFPSRWTH
jgi:hypothetical protein